jgi:hypothetical protein
VGSSALGYASAGFVVGHGAASSVQFSSGYYNLAPYGANPYFFHYGPVPYWAWGYRPCNYGGYYGHGHSGGYYGHSYYGGSLFGLSYCSRSWRFRFGFGFSYSPYIYDHYSYSSYPCYRRYTYYPYCYYSTVSYYPAYSTIYHSCAPVSYVESYDPYVDYIDDVPSSVIGTVAAPALPTIPSEFHSPFLLDFPADVTGVEALTRGEAWMKDGRFLLAAESFRRAWLSMPTDGYPALRLGEALFAAQEYVPLASLAIESGIALDVTLITRPRDIRKDFPGPLSFDAAMRALQRRTLENPKDGEARFLLAHVLFFSGDTYAARQEFRALLDGGWESPNLVSYIEESERILLGR